GHITLPSTIALERATNPFLRCREPALQRAAADPDAKGMDPVAVFARLRNLKNRFNG
ncbi:MAG: hydroxyacylglutathione hydrolase, partial [Betaproteobacteria bacterium]|nr:hydroxyacylglutathione hydrolase [Betaproteobacteria bacterium]